MSCFPGSSCTLQYFFFLNLLLCWETYLVVVQWGLSKFFLNPSAFMLDGSEGTVIGCFMDGFPYFTHYKAILCSSVTFVFKYYGALSVTTISSHNYILSDFSKQFSFLTYFFFFWHLNYTWKKRIVENFPLQPISHVVPAASNLNLFIWIILRS